LGKRLLLHVKHLMHTGDELPKVSPNTPMNQVLYEISNKRLGLTTIVDAEEHLLGIFTDGDLRRVFDMGIDFQKATIQEVMTSGGIRVRPNMLAVDALNLMQNKNITALLVADDDRLLGVVHMHDMLRAGVV